MKVLIINHSDTKGGASVVSRRLLDALVADGVDARMLVKDISDEGRRNPRIERAGTALGRRAAFLAEKGYTFVRNGFNRRDVFKIDAGRFGLPLHRHPWVREADVIMLNWVNQGMLSLGGLSKLCALGKPVVWTMHDMWPVTGICHHAGTCDGYTLGREAVCGDCPFVGGPGRLLPGFARGVARRKAEIYSRYPNLRLVAVSRWMAERAGEAFARPTEDIAIIPNAFPVEDFHTTPRRTRRELGIEGEEALIVMGAARLDDPIKRLDMAISAMNMLKMLVDAGKCRPARLVLYGELRAPEVLANLRLPYTWLGKIADKALLAELYAHATAVISTSEYETLPGTLIEGQAAGAFPVSFDRGGQGDIISDPSLGTLVADFEPEPFAQAVLEAIEGDTPGRREWLRRSVGEKFSAERVVRDYLRLLGE